MHALGDGSLLAMSDNGFGNKQNSRDFLLAVHRIAPDTGSGETTVLDGGFNLSDPEGHVPWTIWRDGGCAEAGDLPAGYTCPDPDRLLTGWDFDIESMQVAKDGTFWFGDEFGPFLLHTDAKGRLLEAPIPTPGVASPSNPTLGTAAATLASSKGFEGMAVGPNGRHLYPMLEGATEEDKAAGRAADLRIYDVALHPEKGAAFTGDYLRYRIESAEHAIGDLIAVNAHQLLVIERDSLEGDAARFKAIYLVDTRDRDGDGYVEKELLVDLLAVPDPDGVGGTGGTFAFPFFTIEDVEILDERTIAVLNDNNYPDHGGRGDDVLDANELITIELAEPLRVDHRLLPRG
ncbi:esterase-like activity of phytase family protein [Georgenia sp. AZ-5]|uniref:esterase-like activity of phytase family protein n=1 Tax=Georgenia sp. AZ-5 TaxID=3367526 RepID=UPI003754FC76